MGLDAMAYKTKYINNYEEINFDDRITGFTLSSRLNDYGEVYHLLTSNADVIYDEAVCDTAFTTYEFSISKILEMKKTNDAGNYGEDLTDFLNDIISSNIDVVYIQII